MRDSRPLRGPPGRRGRRGRRGRGASGAAPGPRAASALSSTTRIRARAAGLAAPNAGPASRPPARKARDGRQPHGELAAPARPVAGGLDRAAVQLDQPLDQRQADPQAALGAGQRAVALREQVEDLRQRLGRDARRRCRGPGRRPRRRPARPPAGSGRPARCTWRRWSAGSRGPAPGVSGRPRRAGRPPVRGHRPGACSRCSTSGRTVATAHVAAPAPGRSLPAEPDLAPADPGDVEQVVDQAGRGAGPGAR